MLSTFTTGTVAALRAATVFFTIIMLSDEKRLLVGTPLANEQLAHERLPKRTAPAVFVGTPILTATP